MRVYIELRPKGVDSLPEWALIEMQVRLERAREKERERMNEISSEILSLPLYLFPFRIHTHTLSLWHRSSLLPSPSSIYKPFPAFKSPPLSLTLLLSIALHPLSIHPRTQWNSRRITQMYCRVR